MPGYVLLLIGGAAALAVMVTVLSGRLAWARSGKLDPETLTFAGAVLNGLFIVILAFYTVLGWEASGKAGVRASAESANLADAYWNMGLVPEPRRDEIRTLIREYTTEVSEVEWPLLADGRASQRAEQLLGAIRTAVGRLPTTPDEVKTARDDSLLLLQDVADHRRARIAQAQDEDDFAFLLLVGTIAGATGMIVFPVVAGLSATVRNVTIMAVMAGALAFTCCAAYEIDRPYQGWVSVGPDAFEAVSREFSPESR